MTKLHAGKNLPYNWPLLCVFAGAVMIGSTLFIWGGWPLIMIVIGVFLVLFGLMQGA